mmetsp:Transcript_2284/g.3240  ORF Transcript_2284/g.3240 Transcript_2284/m.3240 type:complete len:215 (-) Transcript_2284:942-1586(-)
MHLVSRIFMLRVREGTWAPKRAKAVTAADLTDAVSKMTLLNMNRMYLPGCFVFGPSEPKRSRIFMESFGNSQSSINSQNCSSPVSFVSGIFSMISRIACMIALLYSLPPSSLKEADRNARSVLCLCLNFKHKFFMASTRTILNSSDVSVMKPEIDFMRRSTFCSTPVRSNVVIAIVATFRLLSLIKCSRSTEHGATAIGKRRTTLLNVRTAANL